MALADGDDAQIQIIAASDGTFYGQPMTAGDVYTIASQGNNECTSDGGPATHAELSAPSGLAIRPDGTLIITDGLDNRLRSVTR